MFKGRLSYNSEALPQRRVGNLRREREREVEDVTKDEENFIMAKMSVDKER